MNCSMGPPPLVEIASVHIADVLLSQPLFSRLKALKWVRQQAWKQLWEAYSGEGDLQVPHRFQVGDSVYVRCHHAGNLETRWKGPYLILLTTPMAVKVEGISTWIHASHVKLAPPPHSGWRAEKTENPLKLRLHRLVP